MCRGVFCKTKHPFAKAGAAQKAPPKQRARPWAAGAFEKRPAKKGAAAHKFPVRHRAALPHWRRREQKSPRGRPDGCRGGLGLHAAKWRANISLPPRLKAKGRHKAAPHGTRRRAVPCCTFLYAAHCPVSIVRKLGTVTRLGARRQNGAKAALPGRRVTVAEPRGICTRFPVSAQLHESFVFRPKHTTENGARQVVWHVCACILARNAVS